VPKPMTRAVRAIAWTRGSLTEPAPSSGWIGATPRVRPAAIMKKTTELEMRIIPTTTRVRSRWRRRNVPEAKITANTRAE
jgi:hypothetical protein